MVVKRGPRVGTAAFVLGIALAGPHAAGVAAADNPDPDSPSPSASAVKAGPPRAGRPATRGRAVSRPATPAAAPDPAASVSRSRPVPSAAASIRGGVATRPLLPSPSKGNSGSAGIATNDERPQPLPSAADVPAVSEALAGKSVPRSSGPLAQQRDTKPAQFVRPAVAQSAAASASASVAAAVGADCKACRELEAPTLGQAINTVINQLFNSTFDWLATLPGGPVSNLLEGALVLVRRSLFLSPLGVTATQDGNELTVSVNTGSVAYLRQDGTSVEVSGLPTFGAAKKFDAATVSKVSVGNPGNAGGAGLVVDSGIISAALTTTQIDSMRFNTGAAFANTVNAKVSGGPVTLRDAVRGLEGVTLDAPVVLANNVEVDAGKGDAEFNGTVEAARAGKQALIVTALEDTVFGGAVGGQAALASLLTRGIAPVTITQAPGTTTTIPLNYAPELYVPGSAGNGQVAVKYGIDVATGDNPPRTFVFDTGGNAFWAGYNPLYSQGVTLGDETYKIVYTSGNFYDAVGSQAVVTIGPAGGPTISTGQPVEIGSILVGGKGNQTFDFTNPFQPPVDGRFSGDFGAAFGLQASESGRSTITSVLFQLPGNLSSGFLVQLGPIGRDPQLTVGITDELRAQFPYAVPVSPLAGAGTYPVSGYQVLQQFGFAVPYSVEAPDGTSYSLGNQSFPQCAVQCLPTLIDSGAPSTSVRLPGAPQPYPLSIDNNQALKPDSTFVATFPTTEGRPPLRWSFVAGTNGSVNAVGYDNKSGAATTSQNVNTGLNLYNGFDAMFDVQKQVIWLRPNGGQSQVTLQSVSTTGAQTYQQNAVLGGDYTATGGDFSVAGVTELSADTVVDAAGDVTFSGTVDGQHSLEVDSPGTTTFVRGVGQLTNLTKLTTDAAGSTATAGVSTTGDQNYGDDVALNGLYTAGNFIVAGATTLNGPSEVQASNITFDGAVDSQEKGVGFFMRLSTNGGKTELKGDVGAKNPLGGLGLFNSDSAGNTGEAPSTVTADGTVKLDGSLGYAGSTGIFVADNVNVAFGRGGKIQNFTTSGIVFGGRTTGSVIRNFEISDNVYDGIQFAAGGDLGNTTISGNTIYGNGAFGIETSAAVGNLQITDNVIGKTGDANQWGYVSGGSNIHGIVLAKGDYEGSSIDNNTIVENSRSGIFAPDGVQNLKIENNTLSRNGTGIEFVTGDFTGTTVSGNTISSNRSNGIALGAGIGQGDTTGGDPLNGYTAEGHYIVNYFNTPDFYGPKEPVDPQIAIQIGSQGSDTQNLVVALDTGSRGLYFDEYSLDSKVVANATALGPGYVYLNSSNRLFFGEWVQMPVEFTDSYYQVGNSEAQIKRKAQATVPLLVVQALGASTTPSPGAPTAVTTFGTTVAEGFIEITNGVDTKQAPIVPNYFGGSGKGTVTIPGGYWATYGGKNACTDPACTAPSKLAAVANFGVGFDRTGQGTAPVVDGKNQSYNAFLNLTEMQNGDMRAGYVMGATGVKLGLDSTVSGFAYTDLSPTGLTSSAGSPPDWQPATGTVTITTRKDPQSNPVVQTYGSGQVVLDMGYPGSILTVPNVPNGFPAKSTVTVNLLNAPDGDVRYTIDPSAGRADNKMNPSGISLFNPLGGGFSENAPALNQRFFNTGRNVFAGLDYLYDASGGYLGLAVPGTDAGQSAFQAANGKLTQAYYTNPNAPTGVTNLEISGNTITENKGAGVLVNGKGSQGNSILANSIYANDADGIVLSGGANDEQPAPQNVDATKADNTIRLSGAVSGDSGEIRVQVFASPAGQSGGVGGRSYLDEFLLTGPGPFVRNVPAGTVAPGDVITLTATPTATSDTSQFSAPATIR